MISDIDLPKRTDEMKKYAIPIFLFSSSLLLLDWKMFVGVLCFVWGNDVMQYVSRRW